MKNETKQKIIKLIITVLLIVAVCLAIYLPLKLTGTLNKIDSVDSLKEVILNGGAYSYLIFFTIQFLQVTFLPLPAFVTTVAGTLVFGPWIALAISFVSIMLGSVFAFYLGRRVGKKLINWIVGEAEANKWYEKLAKGKYVFFLMMLFPVFPDDVLCMLVGATNMKFKFFFFTNLITRPIAIVCTCFLGSGQLIPFSGWGIPVWIVLVALMAIAFYISWKYQEKIENYVTELGNKLGNKKDKTEVLVVNNESVNINNEAIQTEQNTNNLLKPNELNNNEQITNKSQKRKKSEISNKKEENKKTEN